MNLVPFESQLPAHITALGNDLVSGDDLTAGAGGGYPVISIKGKVFHISRGDQKEMITREGTNEPAASIEVVILRANPALAKTFYAQGYTEGSEDKPTCYSQDGVAPAADVAEKQSVKCATCPHNQWGSKITEQGSKGKACADVRRLAVAPVGQLNDPMLLRVPAASLKPLAEYGDMLKKRGVKYPAVSTKISFDFQAAYPQLTFAPVSFITAEMAQTVQEMMGSDQVAKILGLVAVNPVTPNAQPTPLPAPNVQPAIAAPKPVPAQPAPAPAAKAAAKPAAKKANGSAAFAQSTTAAAPAPEQKSKLVEVDTGGLEADLDKVLSAAGFDDA